MHCIALHYDMTIALHFMADSLIFNVQVYFVGMAKYKKCAYKWWIYAKYSGDTPSEHPDVPMCRPVIVNAIVCMGVGGRCVREWVGDDRNQFSIEVWSRDRRIWLHDSLCQTLLTDR